MKLHRILLLFFAFSYINVNAQDILVNTLKNEIYRPIKKDKDKDSINWQWKRGGLFNFSLSQGSLSNWAAGGDNFSLALSSYFNYFVYYKKDRHTWDNNLDVNLGYIQTTSLGGRKNDDRIDYVSKYGYKVDTSGKWYLSGLFNFRSQFFDGYTYSSGVPVFASSFLSPAFVILAAGFDYKPTSKFSLFLSPITSRWVIVTNQYLADQKAYGVDSGRHVLNEFGAFATINYNTTILKNVDYRGRVDLFSNYLNQPQNINFFMTNQFNFKINKYLTASYSLDMIYDDNVKIFGPNGDSPALQVKSMIGLGFNMPLKKRHKPVPVNTAPPSIPTIIDPRINLNTSGDHLN